MPSAPSGPGGASRGGMVHNGQVNGSESGGALAEERSTISGSVATVVASNRNSACPSDGTTPVPSAHGGANRPPPPPPPRTSHCIHGWPLNGAVNRADRLNGSNEETNIADSSRPWWRSWNKKYVLLCGTCGMSSVLLGTFYLIIYIVLRSYTSSLEFFQTMPTYIPAFALIVTGVSVMAFMNKRNRRSYLIKIVGCFCLVCAVICVIVTVTTTVLHMNRLQTLRECTFYTQLHSCTCLPFTDEEPFELKLDEDITTCDVIHGPLYSCLRAMFGVSVIGILVSIFSCMLVYQLLSHEKKKMYWEQLENRRRMLYRRSPANGNGCSCCDEYGFASSSELYNYPWGVWGDAADERFWTGGPHIYSPTGEDSSNASRSVLLGGTNSSGAPSLWLPWGGAWGAARAQIHTSGQQRESSTPVESHVGGTSDAVQGEEAGPQTTGVLLRPYIPRGLEARFGLRRQHPPGSHGRRPLSDPGVALQLPRYPPPFSEAYLPPIAYQGIEAFPRFMWDPPPPYSQPTSSENIAHIESPRHHTTSPVQRNPRAIANLTSPSHRNAALADMMRNPSSPVNRVLQSPITNPDGSPVHLHKGESLESMGITGSLPVNQRARRLHLSHVKSLGDVTEGKRVDSLEVLYCDGKDITALDRFPSQGDIAHHRVFALKNKHLKSISDPKSLYFSGKIEQESELYFADVSSCVSLRQDGDDGMLYYSEPTSSGSQKTPSPDNLKVSEVNHLYEQVRDIEEEEEEGSHHTSDDTMIVHTSSSDHSLGLDTENTYSIVSPLTDHSSASPMATDTDAYSCYNSVASPQPKESILPPNNLNLDANQRYHIQHFHPHHHHLHYHHPLHPLQRTNPGEYVNDNDRVDESSGHEFEPRYELMTENGSKASIARQTNLSQEGFPVTPLRQTIQDGDSDMNGNVALSPTSTTSPDRVSSHLQCNNVAKKTGLSLPLRTVQPQRSGQSQQQFSVPEPSDKRLVNCEKEQHSVSQCKYPESSDSHQMPYTARTPYHGSLPNSPERRLHTVQDLLYPLKSVNV